MSFLELERSIIFVLKMKKRLKFYMYYECTSSKASELSFSGIWHKTERSLQTEVTTHSCKIYTRKTRDFSMLWNENENSKQKNSEDWGLLKEEVKLFGYNT